MGDLQKYNGYAPQQQMVQFDSPPDDHVEPMTGLIAGIMRRWYIIFAVFLIVAGPVGDGSAPYELFHWDGKDTVPGEDRGKDEVGKVRSLGEIPTPDEGKAEGISVVVEGSNYYDLIIIYDGIEDNVAQCFRADKPE